MRQGCCNYNSYHVVKTKIAFCFWSSPDAFRLGFWWKKLRFFYRETRECNFSRDFLPPKAPFSILFPSPTFQSSIFRSNFHRQKWGSRQDEHGNLWKGVCFFSMVVLDSGWWVAYKAPLNTWNQLGFPRENLQFTTKIGDQRPSTADGYSPASLKIAKTQ